VTDSQSGGSKSGDDAASRLLPVVDQLILGEKRLTQDEVVAAAGVDRDAARRLWRAIGFPDAAPDERIFSEADVRDLQTLQQLTELGITDLDVALQLARVIGRSMARIADAQVATMREQLEAPLREQGASEAEVTEMVTGTLELLLPKLDQFLLNAWRRHLAAATRRSVMTTMSAEDEHGPELAVGFADLVGFTAISQQLDEQELARAVGRFEELAYDAIAERGGQVVKMIGDEVMFVSTDVRAAADIALTLAEVYAEDETLPDVRVGLAYGPVVARDGDYFGPTVNLASRIVHIAYAGATVVSERVHERLKDDPEFGWKALRPRRLKGIGFTPLWVLMRAGQKPPARIPGDVKKRIDERRARRLEREDAKQR
jgi:adenylate cyclase